MRMTQSVPAWSASCGDGACAIARTLLRASLVTDLIGYAAAVLTTVAFLPQALLTYQTKRADGISLAMYSVFVIGIALWFAYGLLLGKGPIIAANAVTLALASFILGMKIRYG